LDPAQIRGTASLLRYSGKFTDFTQQNPYFKGGSLDEKRRNRCFKNVLKHKKLLTIKGYFDIV